MKFRMFLGFFIALGVSSALAGAIKVWVSGETLTSSDLNANFAHIHNTMVGGHGGRLVDSDVNSVAAISHSKLATPALVPKAWVYVAPSCATTPCTKAAWSGVAAVARTAAGSYNISLSTPRVDINYAVTCTNAAAGFCFCVPINTTTIGVGCYDTAGAAADTGFSAVLLDDN